MEPQDVARLRKEFEVLEEQFTRCGQRNGALEHEWFWAWQDGEDVKLSEMQWAEFANLNPENSDEDSQDWFVWNGPWEISEDQNLFGRFLGDPTGFDEFVRLAELGSDLLREFDISSCQVGDEYATWLYQLHEVALLYPTSFLRVVIWDWNADEEAESKSDELTHWVNRDGVFVPCHPKVHSLEFDLFTSSAALCRLILDPALTTFREDSAENIPSLPKAEVKHHSSDQGSTEDDSQIPTNCWTEQDGWYSVSYPTDHDRPVMVDSSLLGAKHVARLIEANGNPVSFILFDSSKAPSSDYSDVHSEDVNVIEAAIGSGDVREEPEHGEAIYEKPFLKSLREVKAELEATIAMKKRRSEVTSIEESQLATTRKSILEAFTKEGEPRRFTKKEIRRRYNAINDSLKTLYKQLREKHNLPLLANHLDDSINWKTGSHSFMYEPQTSMEWNTRHGKIKVPARDAQRS